MFSLATVIYWAAELTATAALASAISIWWLGLPTGFNLWLLAAAGFVIGMIGRAIRAFATNNDRHV
jgi:hypothetical protein